MENVIFPSYFLSMILAGEITNFCKKLQPVWNWEILE